MTTWRQTPSRPARWAVPPLLSWGLQGRVVFGLSQAPAGQPPATADAILTQVPSEDDFALTLADAPPPLKVAVSKPQPRDPGPIQQASFDVRMVNPPPSPPPAAPGIA